MKPVIGVIVGNIVDVFVTLILGGIVNYVLVTAKVHEATVAGFHLSGHEALQAVKTTPTFLASSFVTGLVGSLVAGYVAALVAGRSEILVGFLSAIVSVMGTLALLTTVKSTFPFPMLIVSLLIAPLLGVLGGQIRMSTAGRR